MSGPIRLLRCVRHSPVSHYLPWPADLLPLPPCLVCHKPMEDCGVYARVEAEVASA